MSNNNSCRIRCRQIVDGDLESLCYFLQKGFPSVSYKKWRKSLDYLSNYQSPGLFPKFGYLLESDESIAGCLLTIFSKTRDVNPVAFVCNMSSWYVDPAYRSYAPLLSAKAQKKYPNVTYINSSAAVHTWPLIESQGFQRLTDGLFVAATILSASRSKSAAHAFEDVCANNLPDADYKLLKDHHAYGCLSLWCESEDGFHPFIFRKRFVMRRSVPSAHLIYCRSLDDLRRFSGVISNFLALRGLPLMIVNANGPILNYVGRYLPNRRPIYYRGCCKPRIGELAYTESAIFGV